MKLLAALAMLAAASVAAGQSPAPVRFRIVEANTSVCEWAGEETFTCREVVAPVTVDLLFAPAPGRRVEVSVDGEHAVAVEAPGHLELPASALGAGPRRVTLRLVDGGVGTWARTFRLDVAAPLTDERLPAPVVRFASPRAGEPVSGPVEIRVWAHNPRTHAPIGSVELLVDGRPLVTRGSEPWTALWDSAAWGAGRHVLTARAVGQGGKLGVARLPVEVRVRTDLLPDVRSLHVAPGTSRTVAIDVPPHAARVELRAELGPIPAGRGRVRGMLRTDDAAAVTLFTLVELARPVPIAADLTRFAGQRVLVDLVAEGGAELSLEGIHAEALQ